MKKLIIGVLAAMFLLTIAVYAHMGNDEYLGNNYGMIDDYMGMHDEVEKVLETGTFADLENLREEYNMPVMYWIDNANDFELAKEDHEIYEQTPNKRFGGCHNW